MYIMANNFDNENICDQQRYGYDFHVEPTSINKPIFNFLCYLWIMGKHVFFFSITCNDILTHTFSFYFRPAFK